MYLCIFISFCSNIFAEDYRLIISKAHQEDVHEIVNELKKEEIFLPLHFEIMEKVGINLERINEIYKPSNEHNLNCSNNICSRNAKVSYYLKI